MLPTPIQAGHTLDPPVQVAIEDANGNVVPTATRIVSLTDTWSGLKGNVPTTTVNGIATFTGLSIDHLGWDNLSASATGLAGAIGSITLTGGAPTKLHFSAVPGSARAGEPMAPAVEVQLQDQYGAPVSADGVTVTLTLDAGDTATLGGTAQASLVGYTATFTDLTLDQLGSHKLVAKAPNYTPDTSSAIYVSAGVASAIQLVAGTPTQEGKGTPSASLTATVTDKFGHLVPEESVTLLATGSNNTFNPAIGVTNFSGYLSSVLSSTTAEQKTVTATLTNNTKVSDSKTVDFTNVTVLDPLYCQWALQQQTAKVGTSTSFTVEVFHADGTVDKGVGVSFSSSDPTATVTPASTTTGDDGQAAVTLKTNHSGQWTLTATVGNPSAVSCYAYASYQPDKPAKVAVTPSPSTLNAGDPGWATVLVSDQYDNPVPNAWVTIKSSNLVLFSPGVDNAQTNDKGVFLSYGGNSVKSGTVRVTAFDENGDPGFADITRLALAADARYTTVSGSAVVNGASTITLYVSDRYDNPIDQQAVTLNVVGANGTLSATSGKTNNGVFTSTLTATTGDVTVVAHIGTITIDTTVTFP
jgi:hypothetical protein